MMFQYVKLIDSKYIRKLVKRLRFDIRKSNVQEGVNTSIFNEYSDMNQDGILNIIDIIELVNRILIDST